MAQESRLKKFEADVSLYRVRLPCLERLCRGSFKDVGCHGWEHIQRVRALSRRIGGEEGAIIEVLDLAALFHDIKREDADHARSSADYAHSLLRSEGFSEEFSAAVSEAIASHSYTCGRAPRSLEARVLSDADRLDAMGAVGIYRTIQYNLEKGYPAERVAAHISEKLLRLEGTMHTNTGKRMAAERKVILEIYLESLLRELRDASIST